MTLASVVIPTYNRAGFVVEAIQSVLAQTFTDYEIIVVDDGSTDNTQDVLSDFISKGTIRYIRQDNHGEAAARNTGIAEAKGRYIAFLDSDDLFCPGHLGQHVEYLERHPEAGLAQSSFSKFDQLGNDLGTRDTTWFSGWIYPQILLHWSTLMAVDTVVAPRHVLEEIGSFDESLHHATDLDLWRRIARRYPFGALEGVSAKVRVHSGNISGNRAGHAEAFQVYLNKAFEDDHQLSASFRRQALAKMYAYVSYNLLGEGGQAEMGLARRYTLHSMALWPFQLHAYLGFVASCLSASWRSRLAKFWRSRRFSVER